MDSKHLDWTIQRLDLVNKASKLGLLRDQRVVQDISRAVRGSTPTEEWKRVVAAVHMKELFCGPYPNPNASADGPIKVAIAANGQPIGFHPQDCHQLITGATGSGKSTALRLIFLQVYLLALRFWLIVKEGFDARSLLDVNRGILVVDLRTFKWNPLNPCGSTPEAHANAFADICVQAFRLYDGTKNYLLQVLHDLYERLSCPSLHDLLDELKAQRHSAFSRTERFRESLLNRIGGLLTGFLGRVFDCAVGYEASLPNLNCIFEIGELTSEEQVFCVNLLLASLFHHRLERQSNEWMLVGLDDANILADKSYEMRPDLGLPYLHHLMTTVRKSRINIVSCTQTPSQVGNSFHANAAVKMILRLNGGQDVEHMARSLGNLTREQVTALYQLGPQQIVVKSLRYPTPVLGAIPPIPEPRHVSDKEVQENNARILSTLPPVIPRAPKAATTGSSSDARPRQASTVAENAHSANPSKRRAPTSDVVSDDEKGFLFAAYNGQYRLTLTEIYRQASVSAGTGSRLAQRLVEKQYVKIVRLPFGKGGPKYPVLLDKAYRLLHVTERIALGRGASHEHTCVQYLVAEHFSGFYPEIEHRRIDVAIRTPSLVAIEVAHTAKHERVNIERDIEDAGAKYVVIACWDDKVLAQVREIISSLEPDLSRKTRAVLISEILCRNPEQFISSLAQEEALP